MVHVEDPQVATPAILTRMPATAGRRHGGQNADHAATLPLVRAAALLDAGDIDGQAVWLRIRKAVLELLKPGDGETVH